MKEHPSIDEQIISNKGIISSLRQYNPKKSKKLRYKVFLLCGEGGFIHKIEFYGQDVSVDPDWKDVANKDTLCSNWQKVYLNRESISFFR